MRRNKRILLIAVVSALAVVGAIAIVLVYRWQQPRIRERISAILSENLDSNVELGDVDVSLGLIVRVTAHGLVLRHREHPEAAPLIAVDRFSAAMAKAMTPELRETILASGNELRSMTPRQFTDYIRRETETVARVIKEAKITAN